VRQRDKETVRGPGFKVDLEVLAVSVTHVAVDNAHIRGNVHLVAPLDNTTGVATVAVVAQEDIAVD
jgi:hypothetical protein